MVEPISSLPYRHKDWSYIVFESHLFRVGGSYYSDPDEIRVTRKKPKYKSVEAGYYLKEASKQVKILDLKNIEKDWIDGPEMNFPRRNPHLLILKGKLYVVGGFFTYDKELLKKCIFMEVFENGAWKVLPNHPRLLRDPPKNDYIISKIVIGAIEVEGFIIAGVGMDNYYKDYCFYTYKPEDEVPMWKPYIKISKGTYAQMMIEQLTLKTAVVSGKLMLWLWSKEPNMMYIMDMGNDTTFYLNLVEHLLVPPGNKQSSNPVLLKLEEGRFCLFWTLSGLKYMSGHVVYVGLHSTVFTLKTTSQKPIVEIITSKFSFIPNIYTHRLQAICIADIEDPMELTPFDY